MYVTLADFEQNIDEYIELAEEQPVYLMNDRGKELFVIQRATEKESLHEKR